MKFLTSLFLLLLVSNFSQSFAQRYSYSFHGASDSASVAKIAKVINNIDGVLSVKPRYKSIKQSGEFLITVSQGEDNQNRYPFKPTKIKELLLTYGLKPGKFLEVSSN